jgi:hypothetical protein
LPNRAGGRTIAGAEDAMASIRILGKDIKVEFKRGKGASVDIIEPPILAAAEAMAALINGKRWPDDLAAAFVGVKKIVFFNGAVKVGKFMVARPGMDQPKATFFWEVEEFDRDDADGHANTLFHDSWHLVQFKRAGNKAATAIEDRVAREVDAVNKQIEAARILGSAASDIEFLEKFRDDPATIRARLEEGISKAKD